MTTAEQKIQEFREKFTEKLPLTKGSWTTMKTGIVPSGFEEWLEGAFKEIEVETIEKVRQEFWNGATRDGVHRRLDELKGES